MRLLIVEHGERARVAQLFASQGFVVATTETGDEAVESLDRFSPNLVVIETPQFTRMGVRLCERLRQVGSMPIVVVSDDENEREVIAAFAAGADAFVTTAVGPHELVARVRALLRRVPAQATVEADRVRVGPIALDSASRELRVNGELIALPRREFDIAELLMRKLGRVVTRDELIRELWGGHRDTKSLDVQVGRLRAKLAAAEGGRRRIVTVRGVGYRLLAEIDEPPAPDSPEDDGVTIDLRGNSASVELRPPLRPDSPDAPVASAGAR